MPEVWKQKENEVIRHWLFEALYHSIGLSDWERKFLVSIDKQFNLSGKLSQKQQEILERIYAEKTK